MMEPIATSLRELRLAAASPSGPRQPHDAAAAATPDVGVDDFEVAHEERPKLKDGVRYRFGFVARYLRPLVREKMVLENWNQAEVAEWLGVPNSVLSEYLNRRTLPAADRMTTLLRLGADRAELREAELADRLQAWLDQHEIPGRSAQRCLYRIQAYEERVRRLRETPALAED